MRKSLWRFSKETTPFGGGAQRYAQSTYVLFFDFGVFPLIKATAYGRGSLLQFPAATAERHLQTIVRGMLKITGRLRRMRSA